MSLDANQIYIVARAAGFTVYSAVTATAIALAESSGDPSAIGDVKLETRTWGPSVGLMQIRSLNADKGTGKARDASKLTDPLFNMRAAYTLSGGGTSFAPWSTYTSGAYKQYLADAQGARLHSDPILNQKLAMKKDWLTILIEEGINATSPIPGTGTALVNGADSVAGAINSTVGNPLDAAKAALALVSKAGAWMSDSHNWARVALVVAGSAGVLAGLTMLAKAGAGPVSSAAGAVTSAPGKAAKAAVNVVPVGRAATVASKAAKAVAK
jgi:hypothetical protein